MEVRLWIYLRQVCDVVQRNEIAGAEVVPLFTGGKGPVAQAVAAANAYSPA